DLAPECTRGWRQLRGHGRARLAPDGGGVPVEKAPYAMEEPVDARHVLVVPLEGVFGWSDGEGVEAQRVRAVGLDHVVGGHRVALRLRHDLTVLVHHALGKEARDRLVEGDEAEV